MRTLILTAVLALGSWEAGAQPNPTLEKAEAQAKTAARTAKAGIQGRRGLERLKKDLRRLAGELDKETQASARDVDAYSKNLAARVARLRSKGGLDPRLAPALDKLEKLYKELPRRPDADELARGFAGGVAEALRWAADGAKTEKELLGLLDSELEVPIQAEALLPTDLPLAEFLKIGPIRVFLMKYRKGRPASYAAATPAAVLDGKLNVVAGVDVSGVVTWHNPRQVDGDYTFNFGELHCEITPPWRKAHPDMPLPKTGDTVRIKGWTYYDYFHKTEEEYDPADPRLGADRASLWEVHPVQDVEILHQAP